MYDMLIQSSGDRKRIMTSARLESVRIEWRLNSDAGSQLILSGRYSVFCQGVEARALSVTTTTTIDQRPASRGYLLFTEDRS